MQRELVVVEDSDDDYDAFVRTCRSIGFAGQLRRFADAEAALTFLRAVDWGSASTIQGTVPGLILLDLNLPGMDGRDLLEILKSDIQLCHVPVVVFTTSANASDISYCYSHYANGYHLKPLDMDQFETDVRALLDYWFERVVAPVPLA